MELINATKMRAGYTMGIQPDGRELLVVVVKGTFKIPDDGREATLAKEQASLLEADVFTGAPGFSAPLYESDYAPYKPRCDVILNGSAYAPGGKPAKRVRVSLHVGSFSKSFDVVGNRVWKKRLFLVKASRPQPFTVMPISYNNAFGGIDNTHTREKKHRAFLSNHVGVGFHHNRKKQFIHNKPLPNTEEIGRPVVRPAPGYRPMSFGHVARSWPLRLKHAGTYNDNWVDKVFPFLPADFDNAYYQSVPVDQQINFLCGGEEIVLRNLTPQGRTSFQIPTIMMPVAFSLRTGEMHKANGIADTLLLEPDAGRFMITWRTNLPIKNIFEVVQVFTGEMGRGWWRAQELGKTYYSSLGEMIREKRQEADEEIE